MVYSVLIADDHPILLGGLKAAIDADPSFSVVATAADGVEALNEMRRVEPAIAVLDLNMPMSSGLNVLTQAVSLGLPTQIVILAATASDDDIHHIVTAGAKGLVFKESAAQMLLECLKAVGAGGTWYSDDVPGIVTSRSEDEKIWRARLALLTEREIEITRLVNQGHSNKEIAYELQLVEGTVKVHLNNIFRKLEISTRSELSARTKARLKSTIEALR